MSFTIHSRKSWGARRAVSNSRVSRAPQSPTNVREMFIHWPGLEHGSTSHINTPDEERAELRAEQNFHMDARGWADIGYSYAVFQSGRVYRLRGMRWVPAGQEGHNTNTVAVTCILGPDDTPSDALVNALVKLKNRLDGKAGRDLRARPHSDVVDTNCPGPRLRSIIPHLNRH